MFLNSVASLRAFGSSQVKGGRLIGALGQRRIGLCVAWYTWWCDVGMLDVEYEMRKFERDGYWRLPL